MITQTIQRQYNEVVAPHYDLDPQDVTNNSLDRAVDQIRRRPLFADPCAPLKVLDLGAGTGLFLTKLKALAGEQVQPFALDLSAKMLAQACEKMPDLVAEVDDAANFDAHFEGQTFDLISTHFITGFVPMQVLAPKIWDRLKEGGWWSFMGATKTGYPALQRKANSRLLRWFLRAGTMRVEDVVCIPAGPEEVAGTLASNAFKVHEVETFKPELTFRNLEDFMDYGYRGGWLTPFIERIGLHRAGAFTRWAMNWFVFPVKDHHTIEIALAQKVRK